MNRDHRNASELPLRELAALIRERSAGPTAYSENLVGAALAYLLEALAQHEHPVGEADAPSNSGLIPGAWRR